MKTLAQVRREGGAEAVRSAIRQALDTHPTRAAAARALGTTLRALSRSAARVGIDLPPLRGGRPTKTPAVG